MIARRIAVVGASGQLGSALCAALADRDVVAPSHAELPFEDADALAAFLDDVRPDALVNCSAFHSVDAIERGETAKAFAINAIAVDAAAAACAQRGVAFATVSTDYVFDGNAGRAYREDDAPNPLTAYGASKLAGELLVRRHGPRHYILRTSGVFGTAGTSNKGYTLIEKVVRQAERGEPTRMVADMVFSPSYAPDIAVAIRNLLDAQAFGTHHLTNAGHCSWFEFVQAAFALAGLADAPLEPTTYAAMGNPTRRPMYSVLANTTFAPAGIPAVRHWREALGDFVAGRRARSNVRA